VDNVWTGVCWTKRDLNLQTKNKPLSPFSFLEHNPVKAIGGVPLEKVEMGKQIREERLKKGYTQQEVAEKANICVMYLSEIERGIKMPSLNSFVQIIEALEVSADYILRGELTSGQAYIYDEITQKLKDLTPAQRRTAADILDAYIKNLT
jgi:transcriptional regulator with XRE-family HTH domain